MNQFEPLVTVVVPTHLEENEKYLHWCLKSILSSVGVDLEVICFSSAEKCPEVPKEVTLIHDPRIKSCTAKYMAGVKMSHPSSKYIMFISDDVMVSKYTIAELADSIGDYGIIMNPASNCDATTRYQTTYTLTKECFGGRKETCVVGLKSSLEEIAGFEQAVIDYPKTQRIWIDPGWVSYYCTMIPKQVLKAVGDIDERLDVRGNDVDYSYRARGLGVASMINLGVFCLHFGDKSLPKCTSKEQYDAADRVFQAKYASQK